MKNFLAVAIISALLAPYSLRPAGSPKPTINPTRGVTAQVAAQPFVLADGTPVKLRTTQPMSSSDEFHDYVGEKISFDVVEDVTVNGIVVIAKGTKALGTINEHEGKKWAGRGGKLDVTLTTSVWRTASATICRHPPAVRVTGTPEHDRRDGGNSHLHAGRLCPVPHDARQGHHDSFGNRAYRVHRGRHDSGSVQVHTRCGGSGQDCDCGCGCGSGSGSGSGND